MEPWDWRLRNQQILDAQFQPLKRPALVRIDYGLNPLASLSNSRVRPAFATAFVVPLVRGTIRFTAPPLNFSFSLGDPEQSYNSIPGRRFRSRSAPSGVLIFIQRVVRPAL